ncbi:MAG: neocarzinostatin apoprotein domain-containing protein, partial [Acidimicrobiales bacterium]|nr:neocarzinostatin apoprotein domain-containing protein [Acidimicrobiales bacterium]
MGTTARRWKLRTVASVLSAGAMVLAATVLPSAAQEPDPPTPTPTSETTAPSTTSTTTPEAGSTTTPEAGSTTTTTAATAPPTSGPGTPATTEAGPGGTPPTTAASDATTATTVTAPGGPVATVVHDITVEPAADLVDGDLVTVSITGMNPDAWVRVVQCPVDAVDGYDDCNPFNEAYGNADASGAITLEVRANALIRPGWSETEVVDCRTGGACILAIADDGDAISSRVPLPFDPDGPLAPPPAASIAPTEALTDVQVVNVTASGLVWSSDVLLIQCRAAAALGQGDCDGDTATSLPVGDDGSLATPFRVSAQIAVAGEVIDCRTPGACVLVASADYLRSAEKQAVVPLAFDPDAEIVLPTLTATPDTDLVDGQTVTVAGQGFAADWVFVSMCAPEATTYDDCLGGDSYADVGPTGEFSVETEVSTIVPTATGEIDCRTSAEPCLLVATSGSISSVRAARVELHFDPDGPVLPGPSITVSPDRDLGDEAAITVAGTNFGSDEGDSAMLEVCRVGDPDQCDQQTTTDVTPDNAGTFTVEVGVAATFPNWDGQTVDCREAPGCEVVARLGYQGRRATAPLAFAPPGTGGERYLDTVFDEVEITRGVVYRHTTDATGAAVDLTLDVYQPAGDTDEQRPVVVWLPGGWFGNDGGADMGAYAEAFARRGYVSVTMSYRQRPGLRCCPTDDIEGVTAAIADAAADAGAGVGWLRDNADRYRIDPDAIAVGGHQGGAAATFGLAHGLAGPGARSGGVSIAAALPIAGVDLGRADPGEPPFLAFHAGTDNTAPHHLSEASCARARARGTACGAVEYASGWGSLAASRQRDIVRRSADFLAELV